MLLNGVSIEKMKDGYSKIRNRGIANAFLYMKIIENWGSGIPRIIKECLVYGLSEPELIDMAGDSRVNLNRGSKNGVKISDATDQINQTNQVSLTEAEITLLLLIKENSHKTNAQMRRI
jgi:predicted HTH transcriptional regulator